MTKHIKFEENIEEDAAYNKKFDAKKHFVENDQNYEDDDIDYDSNTVKWFDQAPEDPQDFKPVGSDVSNSLMQEARSVIHGESLAHETKMNKVGSSDQKWARSLLSKGAMADRVAAATVLIQDNPIFNLTALQNLVAMVKPAKKKDSLVAIETLTDLFVGDLLVSDRKLRKFEQRPLSELEKMCSGNKDHRRKILLYWIYEHLLKETYGEFVKSLNTFAHDSVEAHKEKAVTAMSKLLMGNPELENVLLTNIVNKLGDPSQKVASKVIYQLSQVLFNHPNMKNVVLNEIERMLFRPNISPKAQYYGICFLNQFYLNKDDSKVAENLVRVYFSFFKSCIKTGEVDTRLMSGILTGVRRCRPFLRDEAVQSLQTHSHALHKLVHLASYTIALQALALLHQLGPTDRYYNSLYRKLAHHETLTTTHPALLLSLIYRSLNTDENEARVLAFLKRLLQLATLSDANRACALLLVFARLARRRKLPMTHEEEQEIEVKEEKPAEDAEVKSENEEKEENTASESTAVEGEENDGGKKKKKKDNKRRDKKGKDGEDKGEGDEDKVDVEANPVAKKSWLIGDKLDLLNDEDDEEVYHDIPLEEEQEEHKKKLKNLMRKKKESTRGWMFYDRQQEGSGGGDGDTVVGGDGEGERKEGDKERNLEIIIKRSKNAEKEVKEYNPLNRNPSYCGAEHSVMTELLQLKEHYHPTVRLFADKIMQGSIIQYNGDPLKDFSIAQFLDRFAFKNPKKNPLSSAEQPQDPQGTVKVRGSHPKFAVRRNYTPGGIRSLRVNSAAYLNEDVAHIPVDEKFLYDYLHMRREQRGDTGDAGEDGNESDTGSVDSEDFNAYLDKLTGAAKKDAQGSDSEDEEMNYMKEMMAHSKAEKDRRKSKRGTEEGEGDEVGSISGGSDQDEDIEEGDADLGSDDMEGDEDSDLMFSDNDEEFGGDDDEAELEAQFSKKTSKKKGKNGKDDDDLDFSDDEDDVMIPTKKGKQGKGKKGIESMFASAEEFATLLEDSGSGRKQGTSQAVATRDNASNKQLNWEERRDRWVKGYKGNRQGKGKGGGGFGNKRKNFGGGKGGPNKRFKK